MKGEGTLEQGGSAATWTGPGLSKHCLTKAGKMPFVCLTASGGALILGESEQLGQLHKVAGACLWSSNSNQMQNDLSSFWLRPCVLEEGNPSLGENDWVFHSMHFLSVIYVRVYNFFLSICVAIN